MFILLRVYIMRSAFIFRIYLRMSSYRLYPMGIYFTFVFARFYLRVCISTCILTHCIYAFVPVDSYYAFVLLVCLCFAYARMSVFCIRLHINYLRQFNMAGLGHRKQPSWACAAAIIQSKTSSFFYKIVLTIPLSGFERDMDYAIREYESRKFLKAGK